jgi:hypothetical protein
MIQTAPTTDRETDTRKLPGDGKRKPVQHIVRIVVVHLPAGVRAAIQGDGPVQSEGLTNDVLKAGEDVLKGMDAPASSNVLSGSSQSNVTSTKPKKEFDVLKPTDIVVIGREPASLRTIDSSGKPVPNDPVSGSGGAPSSRPADQPSEAEPTRRLENHDDRNRDTVLRVWTESDTIEYQCEEPFAITKVEKAGWRIFGTPDNPFQDSPPYEAEEMPRANGEKPLWVWRSGELTAKANNQQYKATFKIGGELIDPDVVCGDPPPN